MRKLIILSLSSLLMMSCGSDSEATTEGDGKTETAASKCGKTAIETLIYDDAKQDFEIKYAYANYNNMYKSYRMMYLNYDKAEDSDFGARTGAQVKIVVGLFEPEGGEFKPGKYTFQGTEKGTNKLAFSIETGNGMKSINYAGIDDPGFVEITEVSPTHICGTYHLIGQGVEIKGTFNEDQESVK